MKESKRKVIKNLSLVKTVYGIQVSCYSDGTALPLEPAMREKLGIFEPVKYSKLIQFAIKISEGIA